nr:hypothetical protein [Cupriavidus taiwanensis]
MARMDLMGQEPYRREHRAGNGRAALRVISIGAAATSTFYKP